MNRVAKGQISTPVWNTSIEWVNLYHTASPRYAFFRHKNFSLIIVGYFHLIRGFKCLHSRWIYGWDIIGTRSPSTTFSTMLYSNTIQWKTNWVLAHLKNWFFRVMLNGNKGIVNAVSGFQVKALSINKYIQLKCDKTWTYCGRIASISFSPFPFDLSRRNLLCNL